MSAVVDSGFIGFAIRCLGGILRGSYPLNGYFILSNPVYLFFYLRLFGPLPTRGLASFTSPCYRITSVRMWFIHIYPISKNLKKIFISKLGKISNQVCRNRTVNFSSFEGVYQYFLIGGFP